MAGKWVYTLQAPSIWPFVQYADNRELRRQIFTAYTTRCDHGDQYDNKAVVSKIAALRAERAQLLGYKTYADFVLEENMAKTPAGVYGLLNQLWTPTRAMAIKEAAAQQELIRREGGSFTLEPWDWWYYTEKVRKARFDLDEQAMRPYFKLENVRDGAFYVANRLYGITFTPRPDLPVYHPEVQAFEVKDADGTHLGVYYSDYHPRPGKRVGAWSGSFRGTRLKDGQRVTPIVVNVCNFSRPAGDEPALLTLDEVSTLFHELGHAPELAAVAGPVPRPRVGPARLHGAAVADHGELGARAGRAEGLREALQDGRSDPARPGGEDPEVRDVQPGLPHRRVPGRVVPGHGLAHGDVDARAGHDGVRAAVDGEDQADP